MKEIPQKMIAHRAPQDKLFSPPGCYLLLPQINRKFIGEQRFRGMGVVIRRERKGNEGKMGMRAVLEKANGFHKV